MKSKIWKGFIRTNIKKHVACSYGYKLLCKNDKFNKPFMSYLDENIV